MLRIIWSLLLLSSVAGAQAQPATQAAAAPAGAAQPNAAPKKPDPNKVVCELQDQIGTRLGAHKVCMTVAQWEEFRRDEQSQTQHIQQNIGIVSH
jgi:hypothetical protein